MPKKICSNGNRKSNGDENWNGARAIWCDGNIVLSTCKDIQHILRKAISSILWQIVNITWTMSFQRRQWTLLTSVNLGKQNRNESPYFFHVFITMPVKGCKVTINMSLSGSELNCIKEIPNHLKTQKMGNEAICINPASLHYVRGIVYKLSLFLSYFRQP